MTDPLFIFLCWSNFGRFDPILLLEQKYTVVIYMYIDTLQNIEWTGIFPGEWTNWKLTLHRIELLALSQCGDCLISALGVTGRLGRTAMRRLGPAAERSSCWIWLKRSNSSWKILPPMHRDWSPLWTPHSESVKQGIECWKCLHQYHQMAFREDWNHNVKGWHPNTLFM